MMKKKLLISIINLIICICISIIEIDPVFFLSEMRWWGVILASEAVIASIITGKRHRNNNNHYALSLLL